MPSLHFPLFYEDILGCQTHMVYFTDLPKVRMALSHVLGEFHPNWAEAAEFHPNLLSERQNAFSVAARASDGAFARPQAWQCMSQCA